MKGGGILMRTSRRATIGGISLLLAAGLLAGCKGNAQFSKQETDQFKQGPPKEMPAQAREMYNRPPQPAEGPPGGGLARRNLVISARKSDLVQPGMRTNPMSHRWQ